MASSRANPRRIRSPPRTPAIASPFFFGPPSRLAAITVGTSAHNTPPKSRLFGSLSVLAYRPSDALPAAWDSSPMSRIAAYHNLNSLPSPYAASPTTAPATTTGAAPIATAVPPTAKPMPPTATATPPPTPAPAATAAPALTFSRVDPAIALAAPYPAAPRTAPAATTGAAPTATAVPPAASPIPPTVAATPAPAPAPAAVAALAPITFFAVSFIQTPRIRHEDTVGYPGSGGNRLRMPFQGGATPAEARRGRPRSRPRAST
jgi:hypothetical protein